MTDSDALKYSPDHESRWDPGKKQLTVQERYSVSDSLRKILVSFGVGSLEVIQVNNNGETPGLFVESTISGAENEHAAQQYAQDNKPTMSLTENSLSFRDADSSGISTRGGSVRVGNINVRGGGVVISGDLITGSYGNSTVIINGKVVSKGGRSVDAGPSMQRRIILKVHEGDKQYKLKTSDGTMAVSDISGEIAMNAGNGTIQVENCSGDISVESANGAIQVQRMAGTLTGDVTNGNITVTNFRGRTELQSTNGQIQLMDAVLQGVSKIRSTNGGIYLGISNKSASVEASSVYGAMMLPRSMHITEDTRERGMREGEVEGYLEDSYEAENVTIKVRTTNGSITVQATGRNIEESKDTKVDSSAAYAICAYCGQGYNHQDVQVSGGRITRVTNIQCACCNGRKPILS